MRAVVETVMNHQNQSQYYEPDLERYVYVHDETFPGVAARHSGILPSQAAPAPPAADSTCGRGQPAAGVAVRWDWTRRRRRKYLWIGWPAWRSSISVGCGTWAFFKELKKVKECCRL